MTVDKSGGGAARRGCGSWVHRAAILQSTGHLSKTLQVGHYESSSLGKCANLVGLIFESRTELSLK